MQDRTKSENHFCCGHWLYVDCPTSFACSNSSLIFFKGTPVYAVLLQYLRWQTHFLLYWWDRKSSCAFLLSWEWRAMWKSPLSDPLFLPFWGGKKWKRKSRGSDGSDMQRKVLNMLIRTHGSKESFSHFFYFFYFLPSLWISFTIIRSSLLPQVSLSLFIFFHFLVL